MQNQYRNNISKKDRIILGCLAAGGESISELAYEFETNRKFVYAQKEKAVQVMNKHFDEEQSKVPIVLLNTRMVERIVLSCALDCKGSIRDIKEHFTNVYNFNIAEGKISELLNSAAKKAKEFNARISLDKIKIGAHDEIFQAGKPVLVGVDPLTTYIYLMEASKKRDGIAWSMAIYEKCVEQQLNLERSVSDGGTGMLKGISEVFTDINQQSDIFHSETKLTKALNIYEKKAYAAINTEYDCEKKFVKSQGEKVVLTTEKYEKALTQAQEAIELYDKVRTLTGWIKEMFDIGRYSYDEKRNILEYLIKELKVLAGDETHLLGARKGIEDNIDALLDFVKCAEREMDRISHEEGVDVEILHLMWKQRAYRESSKKYWLIDNEIIKHIGEKIDIIKQKFNDMIKTLVRASSIVECINSLIRPYLSLKRIIKGNFMDLLQFYLNNRKYMNSRVQERKGKSPLELLTGEEYGSWLDLLGY